MKEVFSPTPLNPLSSQRGGKFFRPFLSMPFMVASYLIVIIYGLLFSIHLIQLDNHSKNFIKEVATSVHIVPASVPLLTFDLKLSKILIGLVVSRQ